MQNFVKYACINYIDETRKFYNVIIDHIKYKRHSIDHITPKDHNDFEKDHKYYAFWCDCGDDKEKWTNHNNEKCSNKTGNCNYYGAYIIKLAGSKSELETENVKDLVENGENQIVRISNRLRLYKRPFSPGSSNSETSVNEAKIEKKKNFGKIVRQQNSNRTLSIYKKQNFLTNREKLHVSSEEECNISPICKECLILKKKLQEKDEKIEELKNLNLTLQHILQRVYQTIVNADIKFGPIDVDGLGLMSPPINARISPLIHQDFEGTRIPKHDNKSKRQLDFSTEFHVKKNNDDRQADNIVNEPDPQSPVNSENRNTVEDCSVDHMNSETSDLVQKNSDDEDEDLDKIKLFKPKLFRIYRMENSKEGALRYPNESRKRYEATDDEKKIYLGLGIRVLKSTWECIKKKEEISSFESWL